ncbi:hypothetical protein ACFWR9_12475, partial [Streptomyces sp. NPDC058534]
MNHTGFTGPRAARWGRMRTAAGGGAGPGGRRITPSAGRVGAEQPRYALVLQRPVTTGRVVAVTSIRGG